MDEDEFKELLNPAQYRVMREKGTEEAFSGKFHDSQDRGIYVCAACGHFLFLSTSKFDAKNGWPAFKKPLGKNSVVHTMVPNQETEISCKECGCHLGHVTKGDEPYYRINSIALDFHEMPEIDWEKDEEGEEQKSDQSKSQTPSTVRTISYTAGGVVLGAGATALILSSQAALLFCRDLVATAISPTPTTTAQVAQVPQAQTAVTPPASAPAPKASSTQPSKSGATVATSSSGVGSAGSAAGAPGGSAATSSADGTI